jgi:signal transduction histidine kinase
MSRKKPYQNRLEELFSSSAQVPPEPASESGGANQRIAPPVAAPSTQAAEQDVQVSYLDAPASIDRDLSKVLEIGRTLAQVQDLAPLLEQAVILTGEYFGLSSVQIYLNEPANDRLVLWAASRAEGRQLFQQGGWQPGAASRTGLPGAAPTTDAPATDLPIDTHSLVGIAFTTEQPVAGQADLMPARGSLEDWLPPAMPVPGPEDRNADWMDGDHGPNGAAAHASAEMALPLLAGIHSTAAGMSSRRAFGVLFLQSAQPEALSGGHKIIFELLASRLAAAIDYLRLYAPAAMHPTETQARMGWDEFLDAINRRETVGYSYDAGQAEAVTELPVLPQMRGAGTHPAAVSSTAAPSNAVLTTPLQVGSESIGTLLLEREPGSAQGSRAWKSDEVELVKSIADRIAQHLENLRLLAQAERYREEAEDAARRLTREGWEAYLETPQAPLSGYVYDLGQVKPLDEAATRKPDAAGRQAMGAIKVRDELIGELAVADVTQDEALAAGILSVVTERLGAHIENLRLLEETERSRQQLDKRAAELETVARVSTAAATILSPQELLQSVVDLTKYSFNLYHTQVYLLDEDRYCLVLRAGAGKIGHRMVSEGETIALNEGNSVVARAAKTRAGVVVNDVRQDADFLPHVLLPEALSEMAVPMVVGDQLVGVFNVLANAANRFTEEDMRTYNTLASQVAVALRNAELYAEQMATVVRLRELDHLKSSFLANMSHELRTPLNSILGFAQVILEGLDGPLTEDMANDLSLIDKNGQHLLNLINEILDMAKIEAGRLSLSPEPVNLRSLLEDVLESSASLVREKSLYLHLESEEQADITLLLDYTRIRQVFINLLGNAAKFTENGGVTVSFERTAAKVWVRFSDTGIGIPPNKLDMIFEQFSQVDTSTTRKASGTGLGLPISRRLVELHGGRLWAESTGIPGEGSVFTVELPLTQAEIV